MSNIFIQIRSFHSPSPKLKRPGEIYTAGTREALDVNRGLLCRLLNPNCTSYCIWKLKRKYTKKPKVEVGFTIIPKALNSNLWLNSSSIQKEWLLTWERQPDRQTDLQRSESTGLKLFPPWLRDLEPSNNTSVFKLLSNGTLSILARWTRKEWIPYMKAFCGIWFLD